MIGNNEVVSNNQTTSSYIDDSKCEVCNGSMPCKPILLGITGKIGSGKTTTARCLPTDFVEYSFASPLKDIAKILGFENHEVYGSQEQKLAINDFWGISGRKFLQIFGSEVCRDYLPKAIPDMNFNSKTLWIRLFEKFYARENDKNIVVSDVRFEDEAKSIRELGGYIIRVERDMKKEISNSGHVAATKHKSELELEDIKSHFVLRNNGTIKDLYRKVDNVIYLVHKGYGNIPNATIYL